MELQWLEDFLEIAATRNFSTAATARNISQPAFSRRIKSLESWIGADLIDRSTYPVQLTRAGNMFLPGCQRLVREAYRLRTDCRNVAGESSAMLTFTSLHTLAMYFFPKWISSPLISRMPLRTSMHAADFLESVDHLCSGQCDFCITYVHPDGPPVLEGGPFETLLIGKDRLVLVSGTDDNGRALFDLDVPESTEIPYLAYSWSDGYIGKLATLIQSRWRRPLNLSTVYQSALADGLKHMAVAGRGVAWLPQICVAEAMRQGQLVQIGGQQMSLEMEIRIFRRAGAGSHDSDALWQHLKECAELPQYKSAFEAALDAA
ncbi:DNA-binding transcriptional LysR family regulator [Aminobacter lissarensis]|uniref:DNA-binding transcriptional LysR family regulator n=1 Tax=Aminobacter carboxidus TaxID=376165 RepID=A0A8E1WCC5_9HYPH|nr:LysR family transcriptional regulator [Aminobacter lissarensis]MBB6466096.1 DNA-binding transcriptional LysR family regulator [Aminobacter lissarensis]